MKGSGTMKYLYKICGKISFICYLYTLYQLWHLCQYGSLRSHIVALGFGMALCGINAFLWFISKIYLRKNGLGITQKNKIFYGKRIIFVLTTLFFAGSVVYTAIPYHGQLSWKIDEWRRKKEIALEHNNFFETGVEGILEDLDEVLDLPEELYIANEFQVQFDKDGIIQTIYAFLYGKDEDGEKKTYLIDYDGKIMTVWIDGNANGEYEEDMRLSPMMEILKQADWKKQVAYWTELLEEDLTYEVLYMGSRNFRSAEGLQYVSGDVDGDGIESGIQNFRCLDAGGEVKGFEVSLHIPSYDIITPVRYIMEPIYVSAAELQQERTDEQIAESKENESWTTDKSNGTMYFFLDENKGWRLRVTDAAAGSRFYILEHTTDGGKTWESTHKDPFEGHIGVAEGLLFFDDMLGVAGLTGASQSTSSLYITRNGGVTFEKVELPMDMVTELPESAKVYGFTLEDYDYLHMPTKEDDVWEIMVTTDAAEEEGLLFESTDNGMTWQYRP